MKKDKTTINYISSRECEAKTKYINHERLFSSNRRNLNSSVKHYYVSMLRRLVRICGFKKNSLWLEAHIVCG